MVSAFVTTAQQQANTEVKLVMQSSAVIVHSIKMTHK